MNRIVIYLLIGLLIIAISGFIIPVNENDYNEQWKQVEKYVNEGLPKSAIKIVDEIYQTAKSEGNEPQIIKSLIYRISLQSKFEEEHLLNAIYTFEKEIETAKSPEQQILHTLLAELYQWFYQQNRWVINDRGVVVDFDQTDLNTWDAVMINKKIRMHYLESVLNHEQLKDIKLKDFEAILINTESTAFALWPSLYDLLANRAINYFSTADAGLAEIGNFNELNDNSLLSPADEFVKLKLDGFDTTSTTYGVIKLYQHLLGIHLQSGEIDARVDLDLKRLQYVLNNTDPSTATTDTYIKTVEKQRDELKTNPVFVKLSASLAQKYVEKGKKYDAYKGDENRWELRTAEQICNEAIDAYPDSEYITECERIIKEINKKDFNFQLENAVYPDRPILSHISFKNIEKLHFKIVSVNADEYIKNQNHKDRKGLIKKYLDSPTIQKWLQKFPNEGDHQKHTTEVIIPALESGFYMVFASKSATFDDEDIIFHPLWVTKLTYISKNNTSDGSLEIFVVDREAGIPVESVNVIAYEKRYNSKIRTNEYLHVGDFITDKSGYTRLLLDDKVRNNSISFMLEKDCELLFSENDIYIQSKNVKSKSQTKTYLFTDRAIYRPGQTVYFKGIVVEKNANDVSLKTDYTTNVEFRNVNRKEVSNTDVKTNDLGSFHGAFLIPVGGLNGQMTIKTKNGSIRFLVEEYKRPTFEVTLDTIKGEYKFGDEVTVTGKAENYSGSSVMNAKVKYRVVRSVLFVPYYNMYRYQRPYPLESPKEIAHGNIITDAEGKFKIQFLAEPGSGRNFKDATPSQFTIYADVTDVTGEVQSTSASVSVGKDALILTLEMEDKIQKESDKGITIHAKNLSGSTLKASVEVSLYKLTIPEKVYVKRYWSKPDTYIIDRESFTASFPELPYKQENNKEEWPQTQLSSQTIAVNGSADALTEVLKDTGIGEYLVSAKTITTSGDTVIAERYFTLYSSESKKLPGKPIAWFNMSKKKAEPGETLQLAVGSSTKKARIFYEIVNGDEIIESKWLTVSGSQKFIDIPVKESYRGNFMVNVNLIRYNRQYTQSFMIEVPFTNKKLQINLETHRDYLSPGKKEKWLVKISGSDGEAISSELMAGMYDASLDKFRANAWDMNLYQSKRNHSKWFSGYFNAAWAHALDPQRPNPIYVKPTVYPEINWFGYQRYSVRPSLLRNDMMVQKAAPVETFDEEGSMDGDSGAEPTQSQEDDKVSKEIEEVVNSPRTNFNETAFFYPQLKTDSLGTAIFSFTTPDALTEWKLMMLAHSNDLKVGTLVKNIKANKELMVIPNLPRFVRQGDRLVFSAKVVNYTEEEIAPAVNIEFFNPVSMKTVELFTEQNAASKRLKISGKQSELVSWEISIPYDLDMLAYRIKAVSGKFTDSEERMIPVLTNRMLVTETLPMPIKGKETKEFSFQDLAISDKIMAVSTKTNYRYTVEFTSNPAWYAVQALPYLSEPKTESAGNLFNRYYANSLSAFIINSNPKIKGVFESWKAITPDAFYSNLQKNEELKNVVLNATPWVLEAENEAEQKRRIGILFDMNRIANEKDNSLTKLRVTQLGNGAWPWFKGMREDRHTTQNIVLGIGKLASKNVIKLSSERELKQMTKRAVNYLDEMIVEDYEKLKKNNPKGMKNNHLSSSQIEYLYARSLLLDEFPISSKTQIAFDYYLGQAKQFWLKKSNYLQGMIALSMKRFGHRNEAEGIMRSLKERALHSDEMGMYWRNENSWRWYEAPIESQAMMIDAFEQILNDPKSVEQMKVWLLKQKQTTNWKTTNATAEAVYALLLTGENLLSDDQLVEVKVGNQTLVPKKIEGVKVEAGTGYFKTSWKGEEIKAQMGNIKVTNPNNSIAWGAAYWQYYENLDRIKGHDTPLTVEKTMFVEELTDEGPVIRPMNEGQQLQTGDKVVVRLVIGTDRNMEYVHLKDMRASALEPMDQLSGYAYKGGLGFYRNVTDVSTEFFIQYLNKGTYVLEYSLMVTQKGEFSNGIATLQSYYAPEFAAHSEGKRITVK